MTAALGDVMRQAFMDWERQLVSRGYEAGLEEGRAEGLGEGLARYRHLLRQLVVAKFGREVAGGFETALSEAASPEELGELERIVGRSGSGSALLAALDPAQGAGRPEPRP